MFCVTGKAAQYQAANRTITGTEIVVSQEHCHSCQTCLTACPLYSRCSAAGDCSIQSIAAQACITCGACLQSCPGKVVEYQDDIQRFLQDLIAGTPISLLVAPAVQRHFPDYRQVFGFLKTLGVVSFYNVLLRADITLWAYLKVLRRKENTPFISSPCAAVTSYIMKHAPALKKHLMPVYSPLICSGIYLKKYRNVPEKLAFLSPCIAKRSELRQNRPNHTGVDYNITIGRLKQYLLHAGIDVSNYEPVDFSDSREGGGQTLNAYGGISECLSAQFPQGHYRKLSGTGSVYSFLDDYQSALAAGDRLPTLLEVYNCAAGCDNGTGVGVYPDNLVTEACHHVAPEQARNVEATFQYFDRSLHLSDFIWKL
ncbi:[Fe-Fe] hydrogenase large subunit C-terminal domain-containing protein [Sporomusa sphaeroides]|jgi:iron only hydrogenase large subunit-like protein|uniref:[Fe-Fe] hydrogenase large subunit C-terminal domain-containing protein n=1 Tax=Sporomusa sphaeroides TaxID=47679 RepID=UPI003158BEF1